MMKQNENETNFSVPLEIIKASEIEPREVKWLWYPYIPFGKVTLLQGDPGDGKSKLMLSIAALLSKGEPLPFTETEENEPMAIIYQTTEDDADDTVVPRFNSADGNGENLIFIKEDEKTLSFGDNRIREAIEMYNAKLLILDPLSSYIGENCYGTKKAKNTNLKQFAETIRFLEEQDVRNPEQLTEKIQELDIQLNEMSQRLNQQLSALRSVNSNLYAMKEYFETRPVYLELKNKYFGREKFKEEHKKELSRYYRSERILKENLDPSGKIPEGQWKREAARLSEEIAALRKEDKRIHAMLRKYEGIKNHVEALMAEEGEGVSLPETNKREQSTETKEAVRTMKRKKKHHGMEL